MRVLYVEDNEVNQALVARVMRARQNKVLFCEEGEKALEILADDSDIELVLLDIELAGVMSGLDVIRTLRARNDRRPVVAITAYAMMGDRERILEAGCDQYLPKPLVIPDLLKILDHYEDVIAASAAAPATPAPAASAPVAETAPAEPATPAPAPVVDTAAASTETPKEPATSAPTTEPAPADKAAPAVPAVAATPAQDAAPPKPLTPAAESVPAEQPEVAAVTAVPADQPPSAAAVPAPSSPDSPPQPVKDMSPVATPPVDSALVEPVEEKQHEQG